jgi:hypothetical protein
LSFEPGGLPLRFGFAGGPLKLADVGKFSVANLTTLFSGSTYRFAGK